MNFRLPVTVVIPVFNAVSEVNGLVSSLERSYSEPTPNLSFLFSDDASTDSGVEDVYSRSFFRRPDVQLLRRKENGGYAKNINSVIQHLKASQRNEDLVLLNSDTRVYHRVFERLQSSRYSQPRVATVIPLTNRGTVASLFEFPVGGALPPYLSAETLSQVVYERALGPELIPTPSGVGFCLYIGSDALEEIGLFDETFGRGYGEETDWCRRGIKLGWTHQINPHTFVEHSGAASFGAEEWRRNERAVLNRLEASHPEMEGEFVAFVERDELKFSRVTLLLEALQRSAGFEAMTLFILHAEPDAWTSGGTERYSRQLQNILSENGIGVIEMFPLDSTMLRLRGRFRDKPFLDVQFESDLFENVLRLIRPYVRYLNVHHLLRWPERAYDVLRDFDFDAKIFSGHDLFVSCPSYNLLNAEKKFCGVESDSAKCDACYPIVKKRVPTLSATSIERYRQQSLDLLSAFDHLLLPSKSAFPYWDKTFPTSWPSLSAKVTVLEHDLSHLFELHDASELPPPLTREQESKIVFLGHIHGSKGKALLLDSLDDLRKGGFEIEAWGCSSYDIPKPVILSATPYFGAWDLQRLFHLRPPGLVLLPSIWPETFCFTFFESLILSPHAIPIVSPLGHPATVVDAEGVGVKIQDLTPEGLIDACREARRDRERIMKNKQAYLQKLRRAQGDYFRAYSRLWDTGRKRAYPKLTRDEILALRPNPRVNPEKVEKIRAATRSRLLEFQEFLGEANRRRRAKLESDPAN